MAKKGSNKYVPRVALEEIRDVMRENDLNSQSEGWRKMVNYCQVGREIERIKNLNWSKKKGGFNFGF